MSVTSITKSQNQIEKLQEICDKNKQYPKEIFQTNRNETKRK